MKILYPATALEELSDQNMRIGNGKRTNGQEAIKMKSGLISLRPSAPISFISATKCRGERSFLMS